MALLFYPGGFLKLILIAFYLHPIHVTVTEIEYDEKSKALEIMMRVFTDDLETALREKSNQPELDLLESKNGQAADQLISGYLRDHFKISLDQKIQNIKYLGHETEGDAFIFYLEVPDVKKWKTINIFNDILTDLYEDQSNLVHVMVKEEVKSLRLTRNTPADNLTFDNR